MSGYELVFSRGARKEYEALDGSVRSMRNKGLADSASSAEIGQGAQRSFGRMPGVEVSGRRPSCDLPYSRRASSDRGHPRHRGPRS